jgi:hypothetical protein
MQKLCIFICSLFNDAVSNSDYINDTRRYTATGERERLGTVKCKESCRGLFKIISSFTGTDVKRMLYGEV